MEYSRINLNALIKFLHVTFHFILFPPSFYGNVQCTCADNSNTTPSSVYYGLLGNHSKPVPLLRLLEKHASSVHVYSIVSADAQKNIDMVIMLTQV